MLTNLTQTIFFTLVSRLLSGQGQTMQEHNHAVYLRASIKIWGTNIEGGLEECLLK